MRSCVRLTWWRGVALAAYLHLMLLMLLMLLMCIKGWIIHVYVSSSQLVCDACCNCPHPCRLLRSTGKLSRTARSRTRRRAQSCRR
jgi:hypothetical protein